MDTRTTEHKCWVCQGVIVERSHVPYIPAVSASLYGPGSHNMAREADRKIDGWHCDNCGIEYKKLPVTINGV